MWIVAGSHRNKKLPHTETYAEDNLLSHGEVVDIQVEDHLARDMVLRAGEMSLHHVDLIHGSQPNRSDTKRLGFAISFITPEVRTSTNPVQAARGTSSDHDFQIVEPPPSRSIDEALSLHRAFVRDRREQPPR